MKNWPMLTAAAASVLLATSQANANAVRHYSADLDSSSWQLSEASRLECALEHEIPRYGKVRFQSEASKELNLRMKWT